jgi:hypothetical protein
VHSHHQHVQYTNQPTFSQRQTDFLDLYGKETLFAEVINVMEAYCCLFFNEFYNQLCISIHDFYACVFGSPVQLKQSLVKKRCLGGDIKAVIDPRIQATY